MKFNKLFSKNNNTYIVIIFIVLLVLLMYVYFNTSIQWKHKDAVEQYNL